MHIEKAGYVTTGQSLEQQHMRRLQHKRRTTHFCGEFSLKWRQNVIRLMKNTKCYHEITQPEEAFITKVQIMSTLSYTDHFKPILSV